MGLFTLYVVLVASTLFGLVYAARKRTLMRQKFSIPGSPARDLLAWLCCSMCALCQETRTMQAHVRNGEWTAQPGEVVTAAYWTEAPVTKPPKTAEMLGV